MGLRRALIALLLVASAATVTAQTPAPAQPPAATDRVIYFEVAPAEIGRTAAVLKTYRQAAQKAAGVIRIQVLQQIGRPNFFAIAEKWSNGAALQAQLASADNRKLRDELQAALISPFDERLLASVTAQAASRDASDQANYVLTQADAAAADSPGALPLRLALARADVGMNSTEVSASSKSPSS